MSYKKMPVLVLAVLLLVGVSLNAKTFVLGDSGSWEAVSGSQSDISSQLSSLKGFVNSGQPKKVIEAAVAVKNAEPKLDGKAFEQFVKGDVYFAKKKYLKAARAYNDLLELYPDSQLYFPAMERIYDLSVMFLNGQKVTRLKFLKMKAYDEAAVMMENIAEKSGNSPLAKRTLVTLAQSYEKRGEFLMAYQSWSDIYSRWTTSDLAKEALKGMARSLHSSYRGYKYDSKRLESAKSYYKDFQLRYADEAKKLGVSEQLGLIEEQKAYKEYGIAKYYWKAGQIQAASLYYQAVIDEWPKSSAAQLAKNDVRKMKAETDKKKKFSLYNWWFSPEDEDKMFFVKLPD